MTNSQHGNRVPHFLSSPPQQRDIFQDLKAKWEFPFPSDYLFIRCLSAIESTEDVTAARAKPASVVPDGHSHNSFIWQVHWLTLPPHWQLLMFVSLSTLVQWVTFYVENWWQRGTNIEEHLCWSFWHFFKSLVKQKDSEDVYMCHAPTPPAPCSEIHVVVFVCVLLWLCFGSGPFSHLSFLSKSQNRNYCTGSAALPPLVSNRVKCFKWNKLSSTAPLSLSLSLCSSVSSSCEVMRVFITICKLWETLAHFYFTFSHSSNS